MSSLLAVLMSFVVGVLIFGLMGRNPFLAYSEIVRGAFASWVAMRQVLIETTPLLVTALGLAMAFRGRVWNIGAEGQFHLGALVGGAVAISLHIPLAVVAIPLALAAGALGGSAGAWIVGRLKAKWGVSEVITSLMLNYVFIGIFSYVIRQPLRDPSSPYVWSQEVPEASQLAHIPGLKVHSGLIIALVLVPLLAYVMNRTPFGFRVDVSGLNPEAARASGIEVGRIASRLMILSGALSGLAGIIQLLGVQLRLQDGISSRVGFTAIIVAFLGRMRPLGVFVAAFLMAVLKVGASALQRSQEIPTAVTEPVQGLFIIFLVLTDRLGRRWTGGLRTVPRH